jgi:hypothetical protein
MSKRCKQMLNKNNISERKIIAIPADKKLRVIRFVSWHKCAEYFKLTKSDIVNLVESGNCARGYYFDILFEEIKHEG